jgi:hypothetical protein
MLKDEIEKKSIKKTKKKIKLSQPELTYQTHNPVHVAEITL